jgi:hypothetical protein
VLAYHCCSASPNYDQYWNSDGIGRINYYGITGFPTGVFNGTDRVTGGSSGTFNSYRNKFNQLKGVPTPGVLSLKVSYNPSTRTGKVFTRFYSKDQIVETSLHLRYGIIESHKYYNSSSYHYVLNNIERDMVPTPTGISFSINQEETLVDSQSFSINAAWVDTNCYLPVFVQSDAGYKVLISNQIPLYQKHVSGDANGDGIVTNSDVVFLTNYVFYAGREPNPSASGDPNEDCVIDMADVVYLIDWLYLGGPEPLRGWEID